jgi:hypothetical protein
VGGSDAFMILFQQAFRMERAGRARQQDELDRYTRLATAVPILLLEHQRRFDVLPEAVEAVRAAVQEVRR